MQSRFVYSVIRIALLCCLTLALFAQQPNQPKITGAPSEPIAAGTCTSSTFGYVKLDGKRIGFTDAEFGNAIMTALRQGYVLTIYPPTKSGVFINQDCHGGSK